ncbi:aminotransferase class I/II-fold pyridoxal phosphate-dependent enzyme [Aeromicrobium sp. IC_218]|uniref:aminotransferase class I/II-fold pyridoxal phosphate-dependent enzyme n=1 Tax=Aeromicrobium sp. IC_218 TaxID=2545468 RepID=UPI00103B9546|nr:aminotransferase class I/II-fold pyridoxal phosphate-dependent enzyme [Aeromicrobium sp. IC_218]TCI99717.1 aminotransferase [Aeromicrobium sp. IC_218]
MSLQTLPRDQIQHLHDEHLAAYRRLQDEQLTLDITRGKPSPAQLDLSEVLLSLPGAIRQDASGTDVRNYGGLDGNLQLRQTFAEILGIPVEQLLAGENASLSAMHDAIVYALLHGVPGSERPWSREDSIAFICPVPGYDRHFAITERFGIEMLTVPMLEDGPDMDAVRELVADPSVKGMWLVPTYSNPTGYTVSEDVARQLAEMTTAAPDFRIFWDNAYAVHHLTDERTPSADLLGLCAAAGNPDRAFVFASTSKVTFAGSGVGFFGSSPANVEWWRENISFRTIGPDKVNHLRHAMYLRDAEAVHQLMAGHREILAPKFDTVLRILSDRLGPHEVATWTRPKGGYFVSLEVVEGTAKRVVQLAREAGIALTPAGSAFPHGIDPRDSNIRIAPSMPTVDQLEVAIDGLATCVLLAATEQALAS